MIFLSASVPHKGREYYGTENVFAVREAIIAFTTVCVQYGINFYFGGHPAITPLVWGVAMQHVSNGLPLIDIYQSKIFGKEMPPEVKSFKNIHFTECVDNNKDKSIKKMREIMFDENYTECAVFIGGMDGIKDEYQMLHDRYPNLCCLPIASTGGASADLYKELHINNQLLSDSYAYTSIMRELLLPYKTK